MASLGAVKNIMENAEVDFSKAECDSMANALVEIAAQVSKAANVSKGDDE
jgi:Asp-tRNA(Asn)/Glu-tRNA(Gln) amidotransferase C subunit